MPFQDKASFRCKNCGHIEGPEHAGENDLPHGCSVCGAGVVLNPRTKALSAELANPATKRERITEIATELGKLAVSGENAKLLEADNWEILADAPKAKLKEYGLESHQVHRHVEMPAESATVKGKHVKASGSEGAAVKDKASK